MDRSEAFSYVAPQGWKAVTPESFKHDVLLTSGPDGFNRNILVNDQPGASPLEELKQKYERDLARVLKDFQLIRSEVIELKGLGQAVRIIHENTMPGVPVRQVNYIVEIAGKRYFIACTALKDDGAKYDGDFEAFVLSMKRAEKKKNGVESGLWKRETDKRKAVGCHSTPFTFSGDHA